MSEDRVRIGFIGFGNMASAMADGWLGSGRIAPSQLSACAARYDALCERCDARGITACHSPQELVAACDVVVVAVKPHQVEQVLRPLLSDLTTKTVLSLAAGWNLERYQHLYSELPVLCTVPNTPVSVQEGVIACEREHTLSSERYTAVMELLGILGEPIVVESRLLSVAGTVGGCSPAFVAMVIEALADAAVKHGIPRSVAYRMVSQTVAGTARLQLAQNVHPGVMKDAVCSPGGTTIRGVAALEAAGMRSAFIQAIDAIEGPCV